MCGALFKIQFTAKANIINDPTFYKGGRIIRSPSYYAVFVNLRWGGITADH